MFPRETTPSSAFAADTPPREGNVWFYFFEVDFDNSALGSFREYSFIPSRVDNGDFGRGRPYNLIRFSIIHRDIPLPWRGVRVQAHGRGGSSIRGIRGFSFVHEVLGRRVSGCFPVRPPRHPLSRLTPLQGRGMRGSSFLKWVLIIQLWVVFESVVLCLPV